ncbi:MAG: helix-turn-helix domain-containing protein [Acidobacteria bacterium]|nr:helix-turn-helix domain-containing protein [Acidobacteriota bacterium]MBV9070666.1 helix-turn-helix domain-containing protein [Acidobacteriota bacterium]MBV9478147.1 helix-turn-helix domain-containing protein [Acidobacteriota bacterium]
MPPPSPSIGDNLRHARSELGLSLAKVAAQADISVATLSRIETDKQNLDVALLTKLAHILGTAPAALFGQADDGDRTKVTRTLASLPPRERARVFFDASRRDGVSIDDLLSMIDVLRDELSRLQRKSRVRRRN